MVVSSKTVYPHSLNKYIWSNFYVLDTFLGFSNTTVNKVLIKKLGSWGNNKLNNI